MRSQAVALETLVVPLIGSRTTTVGDREADTGQLQSQPLLTKVDELFDQKENTLTL